MRGRHRMSEFEEALRKITEGVNETPPRMRETPVNEESKEYMVKQYNEKHNAFVDIESHHAFELAQKQAEELSKDVTARVYQLNPESGEYDKKVWYPMGNDLDDEIGDLTGMFQVYWLNRKNNQWTKGAKRNTEDAAIEVGMKLQGNSYRAKVFDMTTKKMVWDSGPISTRRQRW